MQEKTWATSKKNQRRQKNVPQRTQKTLHHHCKISSDAEKMQEDCLPDEQQKVRISNQAYNWLQGVWTVLENNSQKLQAKCKNDPNVGIRHEGSMASIEANPVLSESYR